MKIGITGATGQLGRLVVEKLKQKTKAEDLIALVRSPEKATELGIEIRKFDYSEPEGLKGALQGIDHLMLISGSEVGKRAAQHQNIINAAKESGVKWIVYTSLLKADTSTLSLAAEHVQTEEMLNSSGIPCTILRNGWYTENYLMSIKEALTAGSLLGSAGEGKISSATREDFAEAAAIVLTSDDQVGKVYELAGDDGYTLADLAAEVDRQSGKDFPYVNLPEPEYVEVLKSIGVPEDFAPVIAGWDVSASRGDLYDDSKNLSRLIGRPTTPLKIAVEAALK
ncbi:SDR family oxidoreductase [Albibacterium profundi]|uniref:SDR family oxidoreductase n=1 Tax=Albibacterium profundi TaxID=3134906 RepID=A0ABV5CHH2_9SPHI